MNKAEVKSDMAKEGSAKDPPVRQSRTLPIGRAKLGGKILGLFRDFSRKFRL